MHSVASSSMSVWFTVLRTTVHASCLTSITTNVLALRGLVRTMGNATCTRGRDEPLTESETILLRSAGGVLFHGMPRHYEVNVFKMMRKLPNVDLCMEKRRDVVLLAVTNKGEILDLRSTCFAVKSNCVIHTRQTCYDVAEYGNSLKAMVAQSILQTKRITTPRCSSWDTHIESPCLGVR